MTRGALGTAAAWVVALASVFAVSAGIAHVALDDLPEPVGASVTATQGPRAGQVGGGRQGAAQGPAYVDETYAVTRTRDRTIDSDADARCDCARPRIEVK